VSAEQPAGGHPTNGISDLVHQRHRLGILTITAEAQAADFGYLQEALGLTAGNLSRHLTVLEDAGLVQVEKGYEGRRARTRVRITRQGRTALGSELAALTELVRRHEALS
jgi:DNA-binding MarR family transcriptional regulator